VTDYIKIDPSRLDDLAASIGGAYGNIGATLKNLEAEVKTLRSAWAGGASEAYTTAQAAWTTQLAEMHRILSDVTAKTSEISTRYRTAESDARKQWG
jgi:WXG100 family type VII secretion target